MPTALSIHAVEGMLRNCEITSKDAADLLFRYRSSLSPQIVAAAEQRFCLGRYAIAPVKPAPKPRSRPVKSPIPENPPPPVTPPTKAKPKAKTKSCQRLVVSFDLPIRLVVERNMHDGLGRHLSRKRAVKKAFDLATIHLKGLRFPLPATVIMTRFGRKEVDAADNLRDCFKSVKDYVHAELLGVDDKNHPLVRYRYRQRVSSRSPAGARVTLVHTPE